jgi:pimeloyl-ACP methyl ester carboxylesterase
MDRHTSRRLLRRSLVVLIGVISAAVGLVPGSGGTAHATSTCTNSFMPASLGPNLPTNQQIFVRLCLPGGDTPDAVQFLVHGATYDHHYWDFPDPTGGTARYSYVSAALSNGYATLAIDHLGVGNSSHPLSTQVTFEAEVWVMHQVVQALRAGTIVGPDGPVSFSKVIEVGHSFGSMHAWIEASRYQDVDAVVFTGATHKVSPLAYGLSANLYPATLDPKFFGQLDPGYLTTLPGTRYHNFYHPAPADPAVVAFDEQHKQTVTQDPMSSAAFTTALDIRVPTLVALGSVDKSFCSAPPVSSDCTSAATVIADEQSYLGPNVPSVDGYVLAGAGHDINLMYNATDWFTFGQDWIASKVPA